MSLVARNRRRTRGGSGIEYVIALLFVAMTVVIGYRAFGKSIRCRMGLATKAMALDGSDKGESCDDDSGALAQNGPAQGGDNGPAGPTASVECEPCKVKRADGTPGCFVAGTTILTEDGPRAIEDITPGTTVLTRDQHGGELEWRPVLRTVVHEAHALVRLTVVDGAGREDTLVATPDHPLQSLERGWIVAGELVPGRDHLLDSAGERLDLVDGESLSAAVPVYNFEVEEAHTYFVGRLAVWAHNNTPDCTAGGSDGTQPPTASGSGDKKRKRDDDPVDPVGPHETPQEYSDRNGGSSIYRATRPTPGAGGRPVDGNLFPGMPVGERTTTIQHMQEWPGDATIVASHPNATTNIPQHVGGMKESQHISTSKSFDTAVHIASHDFGGSGGDGRVRPPRRWGPVIEIDPSKLPGDTKVRDLSENAPHHDDLFHDPKRYADKDGGKKDTSAQRIMAERDLEVLIEGRIPPGAIKKYHSVPQLLRKLWDENKNGFRASLHKKLGHKLSDADRAIIEAAGLGAEFPELDPDGFPWPDD